MFRYRFLVGCLLAAVALVACKKDVPDVFQGLIVPAHFPQPHYQSPDNPITQAGFELGRQLFYDSLLSKTGTISCASCHSQGHGFADHNTALSKGIFERSGKRNSPAIMNVAWYPAFMWDGGINHLEVMPIAPLTDSLEMGETMAGIVTKLQQSTKYPPLFERAFGSVEITDQKLLYALSQFMAMLVSANSKYDAYIAGEAEFSAEEEEGLQLFRQHCADCHPEPLFTDFSYRNNGIAISPKDTGRQRITQLPEDRGKFKVPSLRNMTLTYPYMHDGRFYSIVEVLDHYDTGVQQTPTLDPLLSGGIPLEQIEKQKIAAFLTTLTDYDFAADPRFAEPLD